MHQIIQILSFYLGGFLGDNEHLGMFSVEENVADNMEECRIYPDIDGSMENYQGGDNTTDSNSEQVGNLDWTDDIDVINVLHGVSEWPVGLQVYLKISETSSNTFNSLF